MKRKAVTISAKCHRNIDEIHKEKQFNLIYYYPVIYKMKRNSMKNPHHDFK